MLGLEQRLHQYEPLFGGWYLRGEIGSGSYGRVYRVENQNLFGVTYTAALKAIEILPDDKDLLDAPEHLRSAAYEEAMSEVETLAQLRGLSNVVHMDDHAVFEIRENGRLVGYDLLIRMELLENVGTLSSIQEVHKLGRDLSRGLICCHQKGILHRDINPNNILRNAFGDYKLGDFGIAKQLHGTLHAQTAKATKPEDTTPLLIVGAGNAGAWAVNLCKNKNQSFGNPVCIVDDDLTKKGLRVQGVPVRGTISDIPELVRKYHIVEIIIAITTLKGERLNEVINLCNSTHCRVRMLSDPQAVDANGKPVVAGLRELNTSDFLSRDEVQLNSAQISEYLHDKVVLVTGGGGSIGSELCRQIMRYRPRQLLIFDIYENCAYELETELKNKYGEIVKNTVVLRVGSIRDEATLNQVFDEFKPEIVIHAAAHKHVPLMEDSPNEAIKNNVFGTYKMARSAARHGVKRFVLISTDKAVNPTNIMGASKRLCEMVVQMMNRRSETEFVAVRFGNVLGSNGSVVPLFEQQIAHGGPVTVTHPEITRFFMTIPEAVSLVLQAGTYAKGGEIFVLDMGSPVRIDTLARNLIRLSGYKPDVDIRIEYTGLRPGEKLYEEKLMAEEGLQRTANKLIHIGSPIPFDVTAFYENLEQLMEAAYANREDIRELVMRTVLTYHAAGAQESAAHRDETATANV